MKISVLQVTKDCNQNCFYCTRDITAVNENLASLKKKIDSLKDVDEIILTGGETTLLKELPELIRYAKSKIKKVHLQSNGINLHDMDYCREIIDSGITSVLIAIPSAQKEVCEKIARVKDIFDKKVQSIINMSQFKNINTGVVFVVNKYNYKEYPEYVKFISSISRDIYIQLTYMIRYTNDIESMRPHVARLKDFKPYLDKGLNLCRGKNMQFRIDGIPLCYVNEYLENVSDLFDRKYNFVQDFIDADRKKYDSDNYEGKEHVKAESCRDCRLNEQCKGLYEYYTKLFGTDELKPV